MIVRLAADHPVRPEFFTLPANMNTTTLEPTKTARDCSELKLRDRWDSEKIRQLVERKSSKGRKPSFLFLGRTEAELLREHLGAAFGPESVRSLKNLYYMGMEVVETEAESYVRTAGAKRIEGLTEALNRKPGWRDIEASSFWFFSVR